MQRRANDNGATLAIDRAWPQLLDSQSRREGLMRCCVDCCSARRSNSTPLLSSPLCIMTGEAHVPYTLGALTAMGGIMGYAKTRSRISLVAGVAFGALFAVSGKLINSGEAEQGHALGFGTALILAAVMGKRAVRTGKLMPAGVVAGLGATGCVYHGLKWKEWKQW